MKAILLAGGKGTRLRPLTLHTPKPIVPIFDRPFLAYQIDLLKQVPEIDEVILSLNYQPRRLEETFGDGAGLGLRLRYVVEPSPLGTGGAIRYAAQGIDDTHRGLQRRRDDRGRRRRRGPPAPRAPGQGHHRADAGGEPGGLRAGRDRRRRRGAALPREAVAPTRSPATPSTPASTCSSRAPSIGSRRTRRTRSSAATSRRWSSASETFVAYVERGYWIDIGTPEKYVGVHRDIFAGRCPLGPAGIASGQPVVAADARVEAGAVLEGPCFVDAGAVVKAGARIGADSVHRPRRRGRGRRAGRRARSSGRTPASAATPSSTARSSAAAATSAARPGSARTAILGDKTALTDFTQV